jgi:hypothetical protein
MVADSVDITTCHPGEEKARRLSLRSVHGKYLVRLLRKDDPEVSGIFPHGTRIEVTVRPSARVDDVLETVRKWVVVPACPITTTIDGGTTVRVGYGGPGEYLRRALEQRGFKVVERASPSEAAVCVNEERVGDMSLAYALSWSETFREWAFLAADQNPKSDKYITLGTCVEGIRVEFGTPGFAGMSIVAIANAVGKTAPKTNVARSGLENTPERASLMSGVYAVYCRHIAGELAALQQRGFSPTWAAQEAEYLVPPLLSQSPIEPGALDQALDDLPAVATEGPQGRTLETLKRIRTLETFWTTEWPLAKTAEWLITESQGSAGLAALLEALGYSAAPLPSGTRVCSASRRSHLSAKAFADRGIKAIACFPELRRVDITWGDERDGEWIRVSGPVAKCVQVVTRGIGGPSLDRNYHLPKAPVSPGVTPAGSAIVISNEVVLLRGTLAEKCSLLVSALDRDAAPNGLPSSASDLALLLALHAIGLTPGFRNQNRDIGPIFQHIHREVNSYGYKPSAASGIELIPLLQEAWDSSYDPYAGSRLPVMAF